MKKFKATCYTLNETFYKESSLDLSVAVAVKYLDKNGEEKVTVGWGTTTYKGALHGVLTKINASSPEDNRIIATGLCEVVEEGSNEARPPHRAEEKDE